MSIRCVFYALDRNADARWLRRYNADDKKCTGEMGYHNAQVRIEDGNPDYHLDERGRLRRVAIGDTHPHDDVRWPTHCICGYEFQEKDRWQLFRDSLFRNTETGELIPQRELPVGAMWYAPWLDGAEYCGPDGHSLWVKTPGGDWCIDSRASNCTLPNDHEHKCWIRHGTPPNITVDKNGKTCAAGAGSIMAGNYHGFLREGYLT